MNHETLCTCVYGMGGVGKTTLALHIHNQLLQYSSPFDHVYWVTVSKASSIYKLQNDIAKVVNLDLSKEDDYRKRAAKLLDWLKKSKKFVLILDDMWENFPLDKVGIPLTIDGGKLLLTTRIHKVCREMGCKEIVKMEPLPPQESWDLFVQQLGYCEGDFSSELEGIVKYVAKECSGLPLALVTVAASMRGVKEVSEWRNALNELREPSRKGLNNDMKDKVFTLLKFSYDRLADETLQQCLLYCSLFPEDFKILKEQLIAYWIGEGLIDEMSSMQAEVDRGDAIINRLIDACLLESVDSYKVKMHDVIRDMALALARENPMFMVKAGVQLKDFPSEWSMDLDRVSLMDNDFELLSLPNLSPISPHNFWPRMLRCCSFPLMDNDLKLWCLPNCPNLKTLLLQCNKNLKELPSCFFSNMHMLTVLDLSETGMHELPDSITNLKSLRVLLLKFCWSLTHIPYLGRLKNLRHLGLSRCGIKQLPDGLKRLINLRVLDLSFTKLEGLFSSAVLQRLTNLQVLYFHNSRFCVEAEALIKLRKLKRMSVNFASIVAFNCYVKSQHWQRLSNYDIFVGIIPVEQIVSGITALNCYVKSERWQRLSQYDILVGIPPFDIIVPGIKRVHICKYKSDGAEMGRTHYSLFPRNMDGLGIYGKGGEMRISEEGVVVIVSDHISIGSLENGAFSTLQSLSIIGCARLKPLTFAFAMHCLPNIKDITIEICHGLEEIISATEGGGGGEESLIDQSSQNNEYPTIVLPKLSCLSLWSLPNLRRIYRGRMVCPFLERISIRDCPMLKRLPFWMQEEGRPTDTTNPMPLPSLKEIEGGAKWWKKVELDHPNAKSFLEPFFYQREDGGLESD